MEKITYPDEKEQNQKSQFRKFISDQIALPPEKWSDEFKKYAERKYLESEEEIPDRSLEEEQKKIYERYMRDLDFTEEELKDKRILDLGCGEGEFVKECMKRGITKDCYGLDLEIEPEKLEEEFKDHFFKANFEDKFPVNELDYIVSYGAVMAPFIEGDTDDPKRVILMALESLREDGQIRIYSIQKTYPGSEQVGINYNENKWKEVLDELAAEEGINYKFVPIDIRSSGRRKNIWLESVLVISRHGK